MSRNDADSGRNLAWSLIVACYYAAHSSHFGVSAGLGISRCDLVAQGNTRLSWLALICSGRYGSCSRVGVSLICIAIHRLLADMAVRS